MAVGKLARSPITMITTQAKEVITKSPVVDQANTRSESDQQTRTGRMIEVSEADRRMGIEETEAGANAEKVGLTIEVDVDMDVADFIILTKEK